MSALGHVCETKNRSTSKEAIELCIQGKDWLIPEYATAAFSLFDMMQNSFTNDFLKLEMEKIHTTIKKRSISPAIYLTGPISISPGYYDAVAWNLLWQEISLKGSTRSIHDSTADQELALIRSETSGIRAYYFRSNNGGPCHNLISSHCPCHFNQCGAQSHGRGKDPQRGGYRKWHHQ